MPTFQGIILGALLALFLGFSLTIYVQHRKIESEQTRCERLLSDNAALTADNSRFRLTAEEQNKRITELAAAQKKRLAAAAKSVTEAERNARHYADRAAAIEKLPASADDCKNADVALRVYLRGRK